MLKIMAACFLFQIKCTAGKTKQPLVDSAFDQLDTLIRDNLHNSHSRKGGLQIYKFRDIVWCTIGCKYTNGLHNIAFNLFSFLYTACLTEHLFYKQHHFKLKSCGRILNEVGVK